MMQLKDLLHCLSQVLAQAMCECKKALRGVEGMQCRGRALPAPGAQEKFPFRRQPGGWQGMKNAHVELQG